MTRTVKQPFGCAQSPLSSAFSIIIALSSSLYRAMVLVDGHTVKVPLSQPCFDHFFGPCLGAMMKQVCWHSRRSKAYRGLPEARGQSEAHGDSNLYNTIVGVP